MYSKFRYSNFKKKQIQSHLAIDTAWEEVWIVDDDDDCYNLPRLSL